jgi:uncharacterized protein
MLSFKDKYRKLRNRLQDLGSAVIAFSGGLDSGLLAKVAFECLGKKAVAITACSKTYPVDELKSAKKIARAIGIPHKIIHTLEFKNKRFINNNQDRCYWCKRELFSELKEIARKLKIRYILDGTNYDDRRDSRPDLEANKEFKVISPLRECGFTKKDVRDLAGYLALDFCTKPQSACLSSRIPFGEKITSARLKKIEQAEKILKEFLSNRYIMRARDHRDILRIEIEKKGWTGLRKIDINRLTQKLKGCGYKYITLDLEGYVPAGLRIAHSA